VVRKMSADTGGFGLWGGNLPASGRRNLTRCRARPDVVSSGTESFYVVNRDSTDRGKGQSAAIDTSTDGSTTATMCAFPRLTAQQGRAAL
jgi:hypothetical protein